MRRPAVPIPCRARWPPVRGSGAAMPKRADLGRVQPLRIELLGHFRVAVGRRVVPDAAWRLRKGQSLVKLLALAPGHRLHREQLEEALWPGFLPAGAANN